MTVWIVTSIPSHLSHETKNKTKVFKMPLKSPISKSEKGIVQHGIPRKTTAEKLQTTIERVTVTEAPQLTKQPKKFISKILNPLKLDKITQWLTQHKLSTGPRLPQIKLLISENAVICYSHKSTHLVLLLPLEALRLLRVLSRPRSFSPDSLVAALSLDRSFDFSSDLSLRLVGEGALQQQIAEGIA